MQALSFPATLATIAEFLNAKIHGDPATIITGFASLQTAQAGDLSFFSNITYKKTLTETTATAVILKSDYVADCPTAALIVADPYSSYASIVAMVNAISKPSPGVHPTAIIAAESTIAQSAAIGPYVIIEKGVVIGDGAIIGAHSYIGENSCVGAGTIFGPHVTLYHGVSIGNNCILHSGVVIGSDGFGFANEGGRWKKIAQLGGVKIGNEVEIGANTTIDRGALDNTEIGEGVILDNQIQIGHNVKIGDRTAIAGCVAIAGSAVIGKNCLIGGGTCIAGHLSIADGVTITGMSGVQSALTEKGVYSSGMPVQETRAWHKNVVRLRHLDELVKRVNLLEKALEKVSVEK